MGENKTEHTGAELSEEEESLEESPITELDEEWLMAFYNECGREVTLSYSTLNQAKNWGMLIIAASISAAVAISKPQDGTGTVEMFSYLPVLVISIIAYSFTLRFFIRAILAYINLSRWNVLQSRVLAYKLHQPMPRPDKSLLSEGELRDKLIESMQQYFYSWRSPIDRVTQVNSNLKLGFALMFTIPLVLIVFNAINLWGDPIARGFVALAIGYTIIEVRDFLTSPYFDTPEKSKKKTERIRVFPIPSLRFGYNILWVIMLLVGLIVATWPSLKPTIWSIMNSISPTPAP